MIEHKLTQMDFDVEEVKQTQPRFFEMLMLCYQVNLTKLQQQLGDDAVIQFADECLKQSMVQVTNHIRDQEQQQSQQQIQQQNAIIDVAEANT